MNHQEFRQSVLRTAKIDLPEDQQLYNILLGLAGECGEVVDCFKKELFHGHPKNKEKIVNEIGDVLFYLYWLTENQGFSIEECMLNNKAKLEKRYPLKFSSDLSINKVESKLEFS